MRPFMMQAIDTYGELRPAPSGVLVIHRAAIWGVADCCVGCAVRLSVCERDGPLSPAGWLIAVGICASVCMLGLSSTGVASPFHSFVTTVIHWPAMFHNSKSRDEVT